MPDTFEVLVATLRRGGALVLSGAGLSTDSGLPDYRGADGERRVNPMTFQQFCASPQARRRYWARSYVGWERFAAAAPNAGHAALARWEELGAIDEVITQNVDGLHQRAGSRSVVELHGNLGQVICVQCRTVFDRGELQQRLAALNPGADQMAASAAARPLRPDGDVDLDEDQVRAWQIPPCPVCGSDLLKSHVVMFGESVPLDLVRHCFELVESCGALVVVGSSLGVMSGLRFARRAATLGTPLFLLNRGWSRGADLTAYKLEEPLGQLLPEVTRRLVN